MGTGLTTALPSSMSSIHKGTWKHETGKKDG